MLLAQVFKTSEGASKRAAFETAHSSVSVYKSVRCLAQVNGEYVPDQNPFDAKLFKKYRWRVERTVGK